MKTSVLKRGIQLTSWILLALLLSVGFKLSLDHLQHGDFFPISVVKIEGNCQHLSQETVEQAISADFPASFWTIDVSALKTKLQTMAWVQSVNIEKIWPETLKIQINEKKVFARWNRNGFISDKGEIFYPETSSITSQQESLQNLPQLQGLDTQTQTLMKMYSLMNPMLKTKELTLKTLSVSAGGAWTLLLSNGTLLLLGKQAPLKRLTRFLRVYDRVFLNQQAKSVDLRYPHGMAVSWIVKPTTQT